MEEGRGKGRKGEREIGAERDRVGNRERHGETERQRERQRDRETERLADRDLLITFKWENLIRNSTRLLHCQFIFFNTQAYLDHVA